MFPERQRVPFSELSSEAQELQPAPDIEVEITPELREAFQQLYSNQKRILVENHSDKEYHVPKHSYDLADEGLPDLEQIKKIAPGVVSEFDLLLYPVLAYGHDSVIFEVPVADEGITTMIGRQRGFYPKDALDGNGQKKYEHLNERESAIRTLAEMEKIPAIKALLDSDPQIRKMVEWKVMASIAATFPGVTVEQGIHGHPALKFSQPLDNADTPLVGLVLATRDLRSPDEPQHLADKKIITDGNAEFREVFRNLSNRVKAIVKEAMDKNISLAQAVVSKVTPEEKRKVLAAIDKWKEGQPDHVNFQKQDFDRTMRENKVVNSHPAVKKFFEDKFSTFAETKDLAENEYAQFQAKYPNPQKQDLTDEQFIELLKYMGYNMELAA